MHHKQQEACEPGSDTLVRFTCIARTQDTVSILYLQRSALSICSASTQFRAVFLALEGLPRGFFARNSVLRLNWLRVR